MEVWRNEPNLTDSIIEEYGYMTGLMTSRDGTEQRRALRRHPVGSLEFSIMLNGREAWEALTRLHGHHPDTWVVPLWQHARRLTSAVTAGDSTLYASTDGARFLDVAGLGRWAILWTRWDTYELVEITDVTPSQVDLLQPTLASWATNVTWLLPCRVGRLMDTHGVRWFDKDALTARVRFSFDAAMTDDAIAAHVMIGGAVLPVI